MAAMRGVSALSSLRKVCFGFLQRAVSVHTKTVEMCTSRPSMRCQFSTLSAFRVTSHSLTAKPLILVTPLHQFGSLARTMGNEKKVKLLPKSVITRSVNLMSKRGKRKTCKAVAKRVIRTGTGKLKRWKCGKTHNMIKKRSKNRRQLRKHTYVSKTQLKLLNKMLNGW
ncbi:predicted protein [Nematostella vectensis]|uniref:50S ribosomal protein L35 n=1 Tax=Nematostella vectensis TaxID=45351 RepID=A7S0L5_NEMVE|nr:uncharacterized protein LOC5514643 [Nematostella vectensis]EDO42693.1 predicted protein [Nematostella vectensis]|eukprot:XP_001634756.1 predicted protein [Nematostella vectensis]